jgi:hypothetical protein
MHDDVVDRVVGRVSLGVEGNPQVVGSEPIRPFLDEKSVQCAAVRTTSARTSVPEQKSNHSPSTFNWSTPTFTYFVGCVGCPVDHRAYRGGEEQDCTDDGSGEHDR